MDFRNETVEKIVWDRIRPTADPHVQSAGRLACTVESFANAFRDEVERRVAFHLDAWTHVMGQDEDWKVIGWIVPPPAFPVHVRPGTTNGSEHIPAKDPSPNILEATGGEVVVNPGRAALLAEQGALQCACWD